MRFKITFLLFLVAYFPAKAQPDLNPFLFKGYDSRIREYVDTLEIIDTHEHLIGPETLKDGFFLDFSLLFMQNGYDDLVSAGMPDTSFQLLFNESLTPAQKWKVIEPYWNNSFNTSFNRIILYGINKLYGISDLNASTVGPLSDKIKKAYDTDWFDGILLDSCRIKYIIKDGNYMPGKDKYFRYAKRFDDWLTIRSKYRIDSLAISQLDPIYTLDDFVKSMKLAFENEVKKGMSAVKVFTAYYRTLNFEKTETEAAKKVFRTLVNGEEEFVIPMKDAKPLQDYMLYQLMDLAEKYEVPVAIHTGLQAGSGKIIGNSDPTLLTNLFSRYPDISFVLYHGSYPFGGELSALAKQYKNVFIDMNWMWSVSPTYSERYLNEWLETVPVSKLIAFGGDCMAVENVYSELAIARRLISKTLINKVMDGYITEYDAKKIAKMIMFDNAAKLYNLN
jgi:uncharacterized protein